ncbi:MAG: hypothetical protein HKN19_05840 [Halioglobus sp.]|nr:hypothetical protein [Halioglobus sp.]
MPKTTKRTRSTRRRTKDRVLQARIPEHLDEELRDRAEQLGMSVSTIVRNVLLNTFDLVEGVVADSSEIARVFTNREPAPAPPEAATAVIGWQEAVLNKNGVCEACNTILPKGARAAIGVPAGPRAALLCLECLSELADGIEAGDSSNVSSESTEDEGDDHGNG